MMAASGQMDKGYNKQQKLYIWDENDRMTVWLLLFLNDAAAWRPRILMESVYQTSFHFRFTLWSSWRGMSVPIWYDREAVKVIHRWLMGTIKLGFPVISCCLMLPVIGWNGTVSFNHEWLKPWFVSSITLIAGDDPNHELSHCSDKWQLIHSTFTEEFSSNGCVFVPTPAAVITSVSGLAGAHRSAFSLKPTKNPSTNITLNFFINRKFRS